MAKKTEDPFTTFVKGLLDYYTEGVNCKLNEDEIVDIVGCVNNEVRKLNKRNKKKVEKNLRVSN